MTFDEYKSTLMLWAFAKNHKTSKKFCVLINYVKIHCTSLANARVKLYSQVHFESKKILGQKKCWVQKSFNSKKNLAPVKSLLYEILISDLYFCFLSVFWYPLGGRLKHRFVGATCPLYSEFCTGRVGMNLQILVFDLKSSSVSYPLWGTIWTVYGEWNIINLIRQNFCFSDFP